MSTSKKFMTIGEIARELHKAPMTVRQMLDTGKIPAIRQGQRYLVSRVVFDHWYATLGMSPEQRETVLQ